MHRIKCVAIAAAAVMAAAFSAGPAAAHVYGGNATNALGPDAKSYTGAWPVTISNSQRSNGTGCLTLNGGATGGSASLSFGSQKYPYGSFLVIDGLLMATITEPLYGQNGALTFTALASRGRIGDGIFENIEGGSNFDAGDLAFGKKNGC
jgi:hypothetical protein